MLSSMRALFCAALALAILSASIQAEDSTQLREELLDLRSKVASFEGARMAPSSEGSFSNDSLLVNQQKGKFFIGGDVAHDIIVKHRDDRRSGSDVIDSTSNYSRANLRLRLDASRNTHLFIKLDLDDTAHDGDLLEECRFVWNQVRGSGWGFVFGKGEVPYGQDKTLGIVQSYHHNDAAETSDGPVFVLAKTGIEGGDAGDWANPHDNVGNLAHPGEVDNVAMIGANYQFRDNLKLEFAVFQNLEGHENDFDVGMHEDGPNDSFALQSFAARLWWAPTEHLRTELSFIKEHRSIEADTTQSSNPDGVDDQYALSAGFDYFLTGAPVEIFGEYQHGWDWNFTDDYSTDTYQIGVFWTPRDDLRLGLMGEWLSIDDNSNNAEDDYTRVITNVRYQWPHDIYMMFEAAYEWYDGERPGDNDIDWEGLLLAFRMGWAF